MPNMVRSRTKRRRRTHERRKRAFASAGNARTGSTQRPSLCYPAKPADVKPAAPAICRQITISKNSRLQRLKADIPEFNVGSFRLQTNGAFGHTALRYMVDEIAIDPDRHLVAVTDDLVVVPLADRPLRIVGQVVMPP